jgi:cysteine-rich repeat protein
VDNNGDVHVVRSGIPELTKYSPTGTPLASFTDGGSLCFPTQVAYNANLNYIGLVDNCGTVYALDTAYTTTQYTFLPPCPYGINAYNDGRWAVTDSCNLDVEIFSTAGAFLSSFGSGDFSDPRGISIKTSTDEAYVTDADFGVLIYNSLGVFQGYLQTSAVASRSVKTGEFNQAFGIHAINPVYVADTQNNRIEVFSTCGNGIVESPEECDDNNLVNGDGCSDECLIELVVGVPEFGTMTLLLAALVALGGIIVLRRRF